MTNGPVSLFLKGGLAFGLLLLYPHDSDLSEAFLERRRLQLGRHAAHHVFWNDQVAARVSIKADFERYVEEDRVHFVLVILGQFDPVLAFLRRQVGGVNVIHGTLGDEPRLEHGAEVGKHEVLKTLLSDIVEQQRPHHVAGERDNVVALEPRTLARAGQPDGEHYDAFRSTLGGCRSCRNPRRGRDWRSCCWLFCLSRVRKLFLRRPCGHYRNRSLSCSGCKGLSNRLLAPTPTSSAPTAATSSATG